MREDGKAIRHKVATSLASVLIASFLATVASDDHCQTDSSGYLLDKLSLQLPRPVQAEFAGFVVPTTKTTGAPRFEDECLQIQVQGGGTGHDPLQELISGRADMAVAEGSYVAERIAGGSDLTVIAGYYQRNGLVWIGMNKEAITNPANIQNLASVGVWSYGYDLPLRAVMKKLRQAVQLGQQDIPLPRNVILAEPVEQNPFNMQQLLTGELDLASAMVYDELGRPLQVVDQSTNFPTLRSKLYELDPEDHGITVVNNLLVVKTSSLTANTYMRGLFVRFLKIVTRSWLFCRSNEAACAAAFSEYGEPTLHQLWQMRAVNHAIFPTLPGYGLGVLSVDRWQAMNAWLVEYGTLTTPVTDSKIDNTLVVEAGAVADASQWNPNANDVSHFCSDPDTQVVSICGEHKQTLCPNGHEPNGPTDYDSCKKCEPGRYAPKTQRMNTCLVCPSGRFSKTYGQSQCDQCSPGRFFSSASSVMQLVTDCTPCPTGSFSDAPGAGACRACGEGTFASESGSITCERCQFGRYADSTGQGGCKTCKEGMATQTLGAVSESDCVCPEGTYERIDSEKCITCPEGMRCPIQSREKLLLDIAANKSIAGKPGDFPRLRKGYYSTRSDPFKVYLCQEDETCPGNLPETCGERMQGLACGKCDSGYYRDGYKCYKCTDLDESPFNYPILPLASGLVLVMGSYFFMQQTHDAWGGWENEICSSLYTLMIACQVLGLLMFTFLQYPDTLASAMIHWTYLVDIAAAFRLSCSEYADLRNLIIVKETAPALMLAVFAVAYVIGYAAQCILGSSLIGKWRLDVFINMYFAVFYAFYIAICFLSLQLFMCYEHPTKDWSLLSAPEIFCYDSDEWKGMLTEIVFAVLVYIAGAITGFISVILHAPTSFHNPHFHERWKFLFIKFKPDTFWWGIIHLLRNLSLCLTLVFFQIGSRQVYYIFIMLLAYLVLMVTWFPWRHRSANLFDLFATCCLLFFCGMSSSFSRRYRWLDDELSELAVAVTFSPLVVLGLMGTYVVVCKMTSQKRRKAQQQQLSGNLRTVFTKFLGLPKEKAQAFVNELSGQNRDLLRNSAGIIVAELLGHQPGNTGLPWRLVHQEQQPGAKGAKTWKAGSSTGGSTSL